MPVSVDNTRAIHSAIKACGIELVTALPETWLVQLVDMLEEDPDVKLIRVAREEEAVGISAGAHLAGTQSLMITQNHGFLASVNPIVSLCQLYKIPLLMLISFRGEFGERDPWQTQGGSVTLPVLDALDIPYMRLDSPDQVEERLRKSMTLANAANKPVALLLTRDLMWEDA